MNCKATFFARVTSWNVIRIRDVPRSARYETSVPGVPAVYPSCCVGLSRVPDELIYTKIKLGSGQSTNIQLTTVARHSL